MGGTKITASKREQYVFIEFLRVIACFLVIVNHTAADLFLEAPTAIIWGMSVSYFFLSKIAVPVFIMIAGYVMLDRQDTYRKAFTRVWRIAICLVLFSAFYYASAYHSGILARKDLWSFVTRIIRLPITNAYWYLYLYLGILLMMPFLQKLVCNMEKRDFHVFFLISGFVYGVWPIVVNYVAVLEYTEYFVLPLFSVYICMLFMGYYAKKFCTPSRKWGWIGIGMYLMMTAVNVALTCLEYIRHQGVDYLNFDNRELITVLLGSFGLFYAVSTLRFRGTIRKIVVFFGNLTFGIYLLSDFFIEKCEFIYHYLCDRNVHLMIAMVLYETVVFLVSAVAAYLLKKVPGVRKLL